MNCAYQLGKPCIRLRRLYFAAEAAGHTQFGVDFAELSRTYGTLRKGAYGWGW